MRTNQFSWDANDWDTVYVPLLQDPDVASRLENVGTATN